MKALQSIKNNIPNTITCLNLLSGCIACIYAFNSMTQYGDLMGYQIAFIFIALAAVFDFCDGLVARLLNSVSSIGKELDSLSDCVSFGLAPAMLIYATLEHYNPGELYNYAAFLIAVFGALRLAKFNVDTTQTTTFKGMPIPANAIFWIGFINSCHEEANTGYATFIWIVVLSYLMVCNIPMFSFKLKDFSFKNNWYRILLLVAVISFIAIFGITGFYYSIATYFFISLFVK